MPHFLRGRVRCNNAYRVRPYGRIINIIMPLLGLATLICLVAFPFLQGALDVRAYNQQPLVSMPAALSPQIEQSTVIGRGQAQEIHAFSIGLRPRDPLGLARYAEAVNEPDSPYYRQFLTSEEYTARFSPSEADYHQIKDYLEQSGFTVSQTYTHRLMIDFRGTTAQAEQAFHVTMNNYQAPDGSTFEAAAQAPMLPFTLSQNILSINGLDTGMKWEHAAVVQRQPTIDAGEIGKESCPRAGDDAILPSEFAHAYGLDTLYKANYQGRGQGIALFELASTNLDDIHSYMRCFAPGDTRIARIRTGDPAPAGDGQLEVSLDAQLILSAVPQLSMLRIYEAPNNEASYLSQWSKILEDNNPIISTSWGRCEATATPQVLQQENILFQAAIVRGQNIFAASGDGGSAGCLHENGSEDLSVSDPSSNPYVIAAGGTLLQLNPAGGYGQEQVWNNRLFRHNGTMSGASGGGISTYWTMPRWQQAPGVPDSSSSGTPCNATQQKSGQYCRQTPDVAISADPHRGYWVYCTTADACNSKQPWSIVGGTSAAAPLWASMMALADEMAMKQYGKRIGFVTPLLYQIARNPKAYSASFHDVTEGNNDYTDSQNGLYPARAGYDMATGLGSYNAYALARQLTAAVASRH